MLVWPAVAVVIGLILLVWSADRFVAGAAAIAHNLGIPHLIIGVTIVSLGTSAPEILVAANAAVSDAVPLAMGNALGSNIANIGLVLGITALIAPLPISSRVMKVENLIMVITTLAVGYILYDLNLAFWEGVALLTGLFVFLLWIFRSQSKGGNEEAAQELDEEIPTSMDTRIAMFWFLVGLICLMGSARALVWGATEIALHLKASELVIGATIVAIGTSLPELAASITSALKGHHDIAIGNVLGSNIFNLLAVMAVPGLINPSDLMADVFWRDYLYMLFITSLLAIGLIAKGSNKLPLGRVFGTVMVIVYGGYLFLNYQALSY